MELQQQACTAIGLSLHTCYNNVHVAFYEVYCCTACNTMHETTLHAIKTTSTIAVTQQLDLLQLCFHPLTLP
jgi:hypothetical protein